MRKKAGIWLGILWCFVMVGGCGSKEQQTIAVQEEEQMQEQITLSWYINFSWFPSSWGENVVSKAITEKTGVDIEFVVPSGDENEKLNSLMNSDSLPDLLTLGWWEDEIGEMIRSDMVYALDELADTYDAYFWQVTDEEIINWYTSEDGHLYQYPNSAYTIEDYQEYGTIGSNETFLVRKDIYEAIGSPDMTTPEGFTAAVLKAQEMFPSVNGEELIPIGAHEFTPEGCDSFDTYLFDFLAVPYMDEDGKAYDRYTDESFLVWLKTFRSLREQGCLKDEIFLDTRSQMEEKLAKGQYFCMLYQRTDMADQQKMLYAANPEQIYIAVDGPKNLAGDDYQLSGTGINGWTVTLISKKCKNPEKAIQLMSYLISEEGQLMTWYGVEGVTWEYDENGKPKMYPEIEVLLNTNRTEYDRRYGADSCYWMLQNNAMAAKWQGILPEPLGQLQEWTFDYTVYTAQYDVMFAAGTTENEIHSKVKKLWGETLPRLLVAESDETFDLLMEEFCRKREELGFAQLQEASAVQMHEKMQRLGLEEEE